MRVLLSDDAVIAVDKPPHVLSVPGRVNRVDNQFVPRNVQWANAILELAALYDRNEDETSPLVAAASTLVEGKHTVPRQKSKFIRYLERVAKVTNSTIVEKIWKDLDDMDQSLNRFDAQSLPAELFSAADFAETLIKSKVFHVHRLDQETSGILLFAKSSEMARELSQQFRDREVGKTYLAKVIGKVLENSGVISVPIIADEHNPPKQKVDVESGKDSRTLFKVIEEDSPLWESASHQFADVVVPDDVDTTLLELRPETGRTHQLRVHLAWIGHPILGDSLYFDETKFGKFPASRLCLHSYKIEFKHPISQLPVSLVTR